MTANPKAKKKTGLLKLVEERALLKKQRLNLIPYLPKEIVSDILLRLPPKSLHSLRFVCKAWHNLTLSHNFIDTHLQETEPVLIFQTPLREESSQENRNRFSVESKLTPLNLFPKPEIYPSAVFCLKFLTVKDGDINIGELDITCLGNIRATCNGLILLDVKMSEGGLIAINPVTRESRVLPRGTLFPRSVESYGFAYCKRTREYKVVHLFRDVMNFVSCEILNLGSGTWRAVDGPNMGLFTWFGFKPVSAIGSLHWIPRHSHSDCLVSMEIDKEKFHTIMLPTRARPNDTILEICGFLCFFTHQEAHQIDVFVLKELHGEDWTKKYSIRASFVGSLVPVYVRVKEGEIVFKDQHKGLWYAYDLGLRILKEVNMEKGLKPGYANYFPHVNSIVSLRKVENGEDVW